MTDEQNKNIKIIKNNIEKMRPINIYWYAL